MLVPALPLDLATVIASVTTSITGFVPDLSIFIAAGVVLGLVVMGGKRLIKAGR